MINTKRPKCPCGNIAVCECGGCVFCCKHEEKHNSWLVSGLTAAKQLAPIGYKPPEAGHGRRTEPKSTLYDQRSDQNDRSLYIVERDT